MEDTPTSDPAFHAARASLYATVAAALSYPTDHVIADITDPDAATGIRTAADRLGFSAEADRTIEAFESTDVDALAAVYEDLFGIPKDGSYPVVPYEASYTAGSEADRQQRRIATLVGLMNAFGIEPSDEFADRQDHVTAELELAQVLAAQRAVALERGDDEGVRRIQQAEATFLSEHLSDFVPPFAENVRGATASEAYCAAVDLAAGLVSRDASIHPDPSVTLGQYADPGEVGHDA